MSQTASAWTGKSYGVERVCRVWEQARSTFYDRQERAREEAKGVKLAPSLWCRTKISWRGFAGTSRPLPFEARGTARCGAGCASGKGFV